MSAITEFLINLINFANQEGEKYFYTKIEDETLFRDYLKYMYYYNGVIGIDDTDITLTKYYYKTVYDKGLVIMDLENEIFYKNGQIDSDGTNIATYGNGSQVELWLKD